MDSSLIYVVVAAHPDDDVLGCGGTISKLTSKGSKVEVVFMADGETSRIGGGDNVDIRMDQAMKSCHIMGVNKVHFLGFPDNKLDSLPLLDIVQRLEKVIYKIRPTVVFTHSSVDLNIDHRITSQAVMTVCRPYLGQSVKSIYTFEVVSSTNWNYVENKFFNPNFFVDIDGFMKNKIEALSVYENEINLFPSSRSLEAVEALAKYRGSTVGLMFAEAFSIARIVD
jgi:N-acetylglucosamine malate deacetylase 1